MWRWPTSSSKPGSPSYWRPADLREAVELAAAAVRALPRRHRHHAKALAVLSYGLQVRGSVQRDLPSLDEAVAAGQDAVHSARARDPYRYEYLTIWSQALLSRFEQANSPADLDEAVLAAQAGVAAAPPDGPGRAASYDVLGQVLTARFELTRETADATTAIEAARAAVAETPPGHYAHVRYLSNLSGLLSSRYRHLGELADLDEATGALRTAVAASHGQTQRAQFTADLAGLLYSRFEVTGELAGLDEAAEAARTAMRLTTADDQDHALAQLTLSRILQARYVRTGQAADAAAAIETGQAAAHALAQDQFRATAWHVVSLALGARYRLAGHHPADLDAAITASRSALAVTPAAHPHRAGYLAHLAVCLLRRSTVSGDQHDQAEAFARWRASAGTRAGPADQRLTVATSWASAAMERHRLDEAQDAYAAAIELLPLEAWHGLSRPVREYYLTTRAVLDHPGAPGPFVDSGPGA